MKDFSKLNFYYTCYNVLKEKLYTLDLAPTTESSADFLRTILEKNGETDQDQIFDIIETILKMEGVTDDFFMATFEEFEKYQNESSQNIVKDEPTRMIKF